MVKTFLKEFKSPGSMYRGAPFWGWNGKLELEELRRQVRIMHRMGMGGFFMHARVGLATRYLGKEWFEAVSVCIDEAKKLGMKAWLYDEDRWPSGFAGGIVTKNPKYRARWIALSEIKSPRMLKWDDDTIAAFTATLDGAKATNVRRIRRGCKAHRLSQGESIVVFKRVIHPTMACYNGAAYLDTLNPEAGREFVRVTHNAYEKRYRRVLGNVVPGIFTDEPSYPPMADGDLGDGKELTGPWTDRLPQAFKQRYGYDLLPRLMEVFFDVDGLAVSPVRLHFMDCVTHLFVESFAKPIYEWCVKTKTLSTGHLLAERTLETVTSRVGSAMRYYEWMQVPGMDHLTEHRREYDTAKCVSSAARQFGRKWRLTETYGCTGWDFPFVGHKAMSDWQVALGINFRCQHLAWYTMEGEAKRDCPASISYQSPWWGLYPKVEDYFARVHVAMTRGVEVRDLLVIYPIESMWALAKRGWQTSPETRALNTAIMAVRDALHGANIDFDYGDEDILARHGKVAKSGREAVLRVAKAPYKAVLVPSLLTMRSTTVDLLKAFRARGGEVVFIGPVSRHVDGKPSEAAIELARGCPVVPMRARAIVQAVEGTARRISITDGSGEEIIQTLHLLREDKDAFYLFVCNTGHKRGELKPQIADPTMVRDRKVGFADVRIRGFDACQGAPIELLPETGEVIAADASRGDPGWEIRTSLAPSGSRLFMIPKKAKAAPEVEKRKALRDVRRIAIRKRKWPVALSEPNVLVLDRPRYRIAGGAWKSPDEILRVDSEVRASLGLQPRSESMVQPWVEKVPKDPPTTPVSLKYEFHVKALPSGETALAIERPELFRITVNDAALLPDLEAGWWTDRSLRRLPFDSAILRPGTNTVTLEIAYSVAYPGLECIYLLGNFGVEVRGTTVTMTTPPDSLKIGDWVKQGLPFYSGSVSYCTSVSAKLRKGERLFVAVPEYRGVGVRVLVDGCTAGVIGWEPNEVDITDFLGQGKAEVRIEVLGHRRNSHGPLHMTTKWPDWTDGSQYTTTGEQWQDEYNLVPCGLMKAPALIVRR